MASGAYPLDRHTAETAPLTPRFLIPEQHGECDHKTRLIDDFRASGLNALLSTQGANIPDNLDILPAVAKYYKLTAPGVELRAAAIDYKSAYRNITISRDHWEFSSVLVAPPDGALMVCHLRALPFGSQRSPASWARMTGPWPKYTFRST